MVPELEIDLFKLHIAKEEPLDSARGWRKAAWIVTLPRARPSSRRSNIHRDRDRRPCQVASALERSGSFRGSWASLLPTTPIGDILSCRSDWFCSNHPRPLPARRAYHNPGGRHWTIRIRKAVRGDSHVQQPGISDLARMATADTGKRASRDHVFPRGPIRGASYR